MCENAAWFALEMDETANATGCLRIAKPGSKVSAWMFLTDEDLKIARDMHGLIGEAQESKDRRTR